MTDNKLMKKHKCPVCGKKFETNRKDAKTCSPKCRQAMYRDRIERGVKPSVKPKAVNSKSTVPSVRIKYANHTLTGDRALNYIKAINIISKNSGVPRSDIEDHMLDYEEILPLLNAPPKQQKLVVLTAIKDKDLIRVVISRFCDPRHSDSETAAILSKASEVRSWKRF